MVASLGYEEVAECAGGLSYFMDRLRGYSGGFVRGLLNCNLVD